MLTPTPTTGTNVCTIKKRPTRSIVPPLRPRAVPPPVSDAKQRYALSGGWRHRTRALLEATELDERYARYVNDNLADYLVPVNADVPSVEVILLSEQDDQINPAGVKGLGELGNVGTNAAVCNAIFHATGQRIRKLPVRLEQLKI
jgi:hypothetical protein